MPPASCSKRNVLMVSTSYPADLTDWRGLFIRHLADALARRADTKLALWAPPGEIHPNAVAATTAIEAVWLSELTQSGGIAHLLRKGGLRGLLRAGELLRHLHRLYRRSKSADVLHINWLQNALPLPHNGQPALITVLGTDMQLLRLPLMRPLLRHALRGHPTAICPNAEWMVPVLRQAFGDIAEIRFVPFGIDPGWFAIDRTRQLAEPHRWLAVTRLTRAKLGPLFEWCEPLFAGGQRELHLFGPMQEELELPSWVHFHGPAAPAHLMNEWFPKACGLITLSRHAEGRPQVMLEAMAAGLPIIASRLPAHENIVFPGETGSICDTPQDVACALAHFELPETNIRAGERARQWVRDEIGTWDDCADRYAALYSQLMDRRVPA